MQPLASRVAFLVRPRLLVFGRAAAIVMMACLSTAKLQAGDLRAVLVEANHARPVGWNTGACLMFSKVDLKHVPADSGDASGIIVGGSIGTRGMKAWAGHAVLDVLGADLRAVITRTSNNPLGASPNSTYLGGELGMGGIGLRLSLGYSRRIGTGSDHGNIFTGSVGLQIPWFR